MLHSETQLDTGGPPAPSTEAGGRRVRTTDQSDGRPVHTWSAGPVRLRRPTFAAAAVAFYIDAERLALTQCATGAAAAGDAAPVPRMPCQVAVTTAAVRAPTTVREVALRGGFLHRRRHLCHLAATIGIIHRRHLHRLLVVTIDP